MKDPASAIPLSKNPFNILVIVAALGYFVDIYDLVLFSVVRQASLLGIGVPEGELLTTGVWLLNWQMGGMLVGGIFWGVYADRRGRLSVLFGSILLYSLANVLNGFVTSVPVYAVLRFIAGIGLAGELGAGITLVTETMHREKRGYGTMLVASIGILGAVAAFLVADRFDWRVSYFVGGGMGLVLLILRIGAYESGLYRKTEASRTGRGRFLDLFRDRGKRVRYLSIILVALPIWYVVGILVTFSPEITRDLGLTGPPVHAGRAIMYCYIGLCAGDLASGILSQWMRSRIRAIALFLGLTFLACVLYFLLAGVSEQLFYLLVVVAGFAIGYWAVFITTAAEQFGTNLRATVSTTAPNFVRGAVVPLSLLFSYLQGLIGTASSAAAVGLLTITAAVWALRRMDESFGKDLDFTE